MNVSGPFGALISFIARRFLGSLLDKGIIVLDISLDKIDQAKKDPKWRDAAHKAYANAIRPNLTPEEKDAIRKEYLDALDKYATFGNGMRPRK